jgi:hypothetical protein
MKNTKTIIILAIVIIIAGLSLYFAFNDKDSEIASESPTVSATPEASPSVSSTPQIGKPTPKPGINSSGVKTYEQWANELDPLNRHFLFDADCTSVQPSGLDLPNNVTVMLDNSYSKVDRVLELGDKEYQMPANSWQIIVLKADKLPAALPMYCGAMELGRIDLVK